MKKAPSASRKRAASEDTKLKNVKILLLIIITFAVIAPTTIAFQSLSTTPGDAGFQSAGAYMLSKDDNATFDRATDSLEAISEKLDNIPWTVNGSNLYFNTGSVGIGTSTPSQPLDIESSSTTYTGLEITNTDTTDRRWAILANSNGTTYGPAKGFAIRDVTGTATRLTIDTSGNVGIGTTAPGLNFELEHDTPWGGIVIDRNSATRRDSEIRFAQQGTVRWTAGIDLGGDNTQNFYIWDTTAGSARFFIDSSGNVGIGTTSPTSILSVVGSRIAITNSNQGVTLTADESNNRVVLDVGGSGHSSDSIHFGDLAATGNEVTTFGDVGIGTTSPSRKLELYQTDSSDALLRLSSKDSLAGSPPESAIEFYGSSTGDVSNVFQAGRIYGVYDGNSWGDARLTLQSVISGGSFTDTLSLKNGNVGIGVTAPSTALEVSGTVTATTFAGDGSSLTGITGVPVGSVLPYAAGSAPSGWLACDGSAVSRTTYADLFTIIGTTYGVGDGSTTFNLPDMSGRIPIGSGTGTDTPTGGQSRSAVQQSFTLGDAAGEYVHLMSESEMPNHRHEISGYLHNDSYPSSLSGNVVRTAYAGSGTAKTQYTGSDTAHNLIQPYLTLNYIIKH